MLEFWFYKSFTICWSRKKQKTYFLRNVLSFSPACGGIKFYVSFKTDGGYKGLLNLTGLLYLFCYEQDKMVFSSNLHSYFINRGSGHLSLFVYILVC